MSEDIYQQRYLDHIARKREALASRPILPTFWSVLEARHSQRTFTDQPFDAETMSRIYQAIRLAPSSCNRQAILVRVIWDNSDLVALGRLLVGGADWLAYAYVVLLLFADMRAYKSPIEKNYMPWLDAGFVAENVYLAAEALGLGCCYVNPNIRDENKCAFTERFNMMLGLRFCGAIALGHYDVRGPESPKRSVEDIFYPEEL